MKLMFSILILTSTIFASSQNYFTSLRNDSLHITKTQCKQTVNTLKQELLFKKDWLCNGKIKLPR